MRPDPADPRFTQHAVQRARERFGLRGPDHRIRRVLSSVLLEGTVVAEKVLDSGVPQAVIASALGSSPIRFVVDAETGVCVTVIDPEEP